MSKTLNKWNPTRFMLAGEEFYGRVYYRRGKTLLYSESLRNAAPFSTLIHVGGEAYRVDEYGLTGKHGNPRVTLLPVKEFADKHSPVLDKRFAVVQDAARRWGVLDTLALDFNPDGDTFAPWAEYAEDYGSFWGEAVYYAAILNRRENDPNMLSWEKFVPRVADLHRNL